MDKTEGETGHQNPLDEIRCRRPDRLEASMGPTRLRDEHEQGPNTEDQGPSVIDWRGCRHNQQNHNGEEHKSQSNYPNIDDELTQAARVGADFPLSPDLCASVNNDKQVGYDGCGVGPDAKTLRPKFSRQVSAQTEGDRLARQLACDQDREVMNRTAFHRRCDFRRGRQGRMFTAPGRAVWSLAIARPNAVNRPSSRPTHIVCRSQLQGLMLVSSANGRKANPTLFTRRDIEFRPISIDQLAAH